MDSSLLRNISEFINKPAKSTDSNLERNLDSELFKTASCLKRKTIQLDNATDSAALIDLDLKTKSEKIAKLQQDKHFLYEKTVSINDDYTRLKQELNDLKQSSCFQINQLESRINSLNDQVDEKSIELSNVVGKSSQDFIILNSKLSNLESRNKELTLKVA